MKTPIQTRDAPEAIGTYSQAVKAGETVYLSGQIGLDPATMQMAEGIDGQTHRVFRNLAAVAAYLLRSVVHTVRDSLSIGLTRFRERVLILGGTVANPLLGTCAIGWAESAAG